MGLIDDEILRDALGEWERKLLKLYADHDMCAKPVAEQVFCHRNTVEYYFQKVKHKTGLNPKRFHDLRVLIDFIEREEEHEQTIV